MITSANAVNAVRQKIVTFLRSRRGKGIVGGTVAVGGGAYGVHRWRKHDPEFSLALGGKRGKVLIPPRQIDQWLRKEVDPVLPGYSIDRVSGYWKGTREPSRILTYYGPRSDARKMRGLAESYKKKFRQESVLYTQQNPRVRFL